ncbi:MAG: membrane protein insertase YidC [Rickettsiales bacterium]|nr:membrane protein insertase YidC [Rickettsiales bacterium]
MVKYMDNNSGFNQWVENKQKAAKQSGTAKPSKFTGFLWWMVIFAAAWWLFSWWTAPKKTDIPVNAAEVATIEDVASIPISNINSDKIAAQVQGLRISQIELTDYTQDKNVDADKKVTLLSGTREFTEIGFLATGTTAPTSNTKWTTTPFLGANIMTWRNADNVQFKRTVSVENYVITVTDEMTNKSAADVSFAPYARTVRAGSSENVAVATGGIAYVNSDIERTDWKKLEKKPRAYQTVGGFVGFADQYWQTVVSIDTPDQTVRMKKVVDRYQADTSAAPVQIGAGKTATVTTKIFAGPRDQSVLRDAAVSIPGLNQTIDYGWFWFLSRPLLWSLNAIHSFVLNYGLAIILLTIALRVLMWPLTRKSYTSMAAMQKMQPELQKIQKLYANDKARQQMEMMKLYQTHKTSPMSGCLPMLLQIPIFFGLYKALLISVPMRGAGFLWISDLAVMDPYFILPILMGATMWWQQSLQTAKAINSDSSDPMAQTQKIMKWMPIVFTFMFAWMPAGLVLYWTVSNLFGIGQMYVIKKSMKK